MNVLLINGSPHEKGCTYTALSLIAGELEANGWVLPIETVFTPLPALRVNDGVKAHLLNGCPTSHYAAADGRYRAYDSAGAFLGLATVEGGVLKVEKLFCERG